MRFEQYSYEFPKVLLKAAALATEGTSVRILLVCGALACALALLGPPAALAGPGLRVGAVDDAAIWSNPGTQMDLARLGGFDTVRMTAQWTYGTTALPGAHMARLQNAATAAVARGIRPVVALYNAGSSSTPADDGSRSQFVQFVQNTVSSLPWVTTFIVGNEPNSNVYWMPQFDSSDGDAAAVAYERLLADSYDAIKAVRPDATVVGGALDPRGGDDPAGAKPSHSPTTFIRDLGAAYRASGRTTPIMDVFDHHVYADTSALPPSMTHASATIALGDYPKLVAELGKAFDGTAQRGSTLPIVYGEFGVESIVPVDRGGAYAGVEPASSGAVDEATQARYYTEAFKLALCQPNVIGILVFHVTDENVLPTWQSGPFYANGAPKSSMPAIRDAADGARAGTVASCPDRSAPQVAIAGPTADGAVTGTIADEVGVGRVELVVNDAVVGVKFAAPFTFPWTPPQPGRYTLELRAYDAVGNVGRSSVTVTAVRGGARWSFGAPPTNDLFAAPRRLASWRGLVTGTAAFAAAERGEPLRKSVWYSWRAPATGKLKLTAAGARVAVFTGGSVPALRRVAVAGTTVSFVASRGTTYRIAADGSRAFRLAWNRG
jgi:hypothetical protein